MENYFVGLKVWHQNYRPYVYSLKSKWNRKLKKYGLAWHGLVRLLVIPHWGHLKTPNRTFTNSQKYEYTPVSVIRWKPSDRSGGHWIDLMSDTSVFKTHLGTSNIIMLLLGRIIYTLNIIHPSVTVTNRHRIGTGSLTPDHWHRGVVIFRVDLKVPNLGSPRQQPQMEFYSSYRLR